MKTQKKFMSFKNLKWYFFIFLVSCVGTDFETEVESLLRISSTGLEIPETSDFQFEATFTNSLGQEVPDANFIWSSIDPSVLSINENGLANAIAEGETTVVVQFDGLVDSANVIVTASQERLILTNFVTALTVGNFFAFDFDYVNASGEPDVETVTWSSSDESILTVNQSGTVTAVSEGTAIITVSNERVSDQVEVQSTMEEVILEEEVRIITFSGNKTVGDQFQFEAAFINDMGQQDASVVIDWASTNPGVLSIDDNGLATANEAGNAIIIASVGALADSIDVTVAAAEVNERSGTLRGRSGYRVSGNFTISENDEGQVILTIQNAEVSSAPGPYYYLSNSSNNVNGGLNLGPAPRGNSTYNITEIDGSVTVESFDFLIVWCEPFSLTLGFGEFED